MLRWLSELYYKGIQEDSRLGVKLTGNWETLVGDQDTFVHILEYENYAGFDKTTQLVRTSQVRFSWLSHFMFVWNHGRQHLERYKAMLPFLTSRTTQLNQEFAILPTAPPRAEGGVFELRTYQLKPGTLLEWENTWCFTLDYSCIPHVLTAFIFAGEEVSKRAESLLHQLGRGSRKSGVFTRSITCGNIRKKILGFGIMK